MSKDIRSFFKVQGGLSQKNKNVEKFKIKPSELLSDDDIIPGSPDVRLKTEKKKNHKKRIICDDSDEEIFDKSKESNSSKINKHDKKKNKSPLKEVKALDIFGSGPIKRTKVPKNAKKSETSTTEAELTIHSDDEFEKTLLQLDEPKEIRNGVKDAEETKCDEIYSKKEALEDSVKKEKDNRPVKKIKEKESRNKKKESHNEKEKQKSIKIEVSPKENKSSNSEIEKSNKNEESPKKKSKYFNSKVNGSHSEKHNYNEVSEHKNKYDSTKIEYVSPSKTNENCQEMKHMKAESVTKNKKKRDFSEFMDIGSEHNESMVDDAPKAKSKKRKCDGSASVSLNESVISDEERFERKRHSAMLYKNYLNRTGPTNPGSKDIPEGTPNCLRDLSFVLSGVFESFEKDQLKEAIIKYGGVVKSGISKKVTHIIAGEDAGPAKLAKAEELGLKVLDEDGFLKLINDLSNLKTKTGKSNDMNIKIDNSKPKSEKCSNTTEMSYSLNNNQKKENALGDKLLFNAFTNKITDELKEEVKSKSFETTSVKEIKPSAFYKNKSEPGKVKAEPMEVADIKMAGNKVETKSTESITPAPDSSALMWVDKYKPKTLKQIIGQNGDASIAKKLTNWLMKWYINRKEKHSKPNPWAKKDDGAFFKAALLSGPPGIGKTTTVSLVCAELGFDFVEFNASDTRSKNLIKDQITELLTTTSLSGFVKGQTGKKAVSRKHCLVMDEVDGMAGNEDRGGLQELISLIKLSAVPIICMCNDRNNAKMRTLVNYCYDLRFNRPRVDQIKSAMMSVCFKEGIKISPDALTQLIVAANQDVRQTLNLLSMWSITDKNITSDGAKKDTQSIRKDIKLGPWEVVRKVFSAEEQKTMSIHDKSDLFFYDYSIAPLFVQENYIQVAPHCPKNEVLKRISRAADSISLGDMVEAKIRSSSAWSLLPVQAMYSSVIPGHWMSGHVAGQIQFPAWLGKNSKNSKMQRLAQDIHAHTRLSASGSKSAIFLDYAKQLRDAIVQPLVNDKAEGIPRSLEVLQAYHLLREDLDSLTELSMWPGQRDPMVLVDSKVKAAMTRAYNKETMALPYAQSSVKKASRANQSEADNVVPSSEGDETEDVDEDSDSDPENDAMIKKKKKAPSKESSSSEPKGKGKKGKGRN